MTPNDQREAFGYCDETCPAVDAAFADLADDLLPLVASVNQDASQALLDACCEAVKDKATLRLRAALVEACRDKQEVERDRDELATEVRSLNDTVADLREQVKALESELSEATA